MASRIHSDSDHAITHRLARDHERESAAPHSRRQPIPLVREGTVKTLIEKARETGGES